MCKCQTLSSEYQKVNQIYSIRFEIFYPNSRPKDQFQTVIKSSIFIKLEISVWRTLIRFYRHSRMNTVFIMLCIILHTITFVFLYHSLLNFSFPVKRSEIFEAKLIANQTVQKIFFLYLRIFDLRFHYENHNDVVYFVPVIN